MPSDNWLFCICSSSINTIFTRSKSSVFFRNVVNLNFAGDVYAEVESYSDVIIN